MFYFSFRQITLNRSPYCLLKFQRTSYSYQTWLIKYIYTSHTANLMTSLGFCLLPNIHIFIPVGSIQYDFRRPYCNRTWLHIDTFRLTQRTLLFEYTAGWRKSRDYHISISRSPTAFIRFWNIHAFMKILSQLKIELGISTI